MTSEGIEHFSPLRINSNRFGCCFQRSFVFKTCTSNRDCPNYMLQIIGTNFLNVNRTIVKKYSQSLVDVHNMKKVNFFKFFFFKFLTATFMLKRIRIPVTKKKPGSEWKRTFLRIFLMDSILQGSLWNGSTCNFKFSGDNLVPKVLSFYSMQTLLFHEFALHKINLFLAY